MTVTDCTFNFISHQSIRKAYNPSNNRAKNTTQDRSRSIPRLCINPSVLLTPIAKLSSFCMVSIRIYWNTMDRLAYLSRMNLIIYDRYILWWRWRRWFSIVIDDYRLWRRDWVGGSHFPDFSSYIQNCFKMFIKLLLYNSS